VGPDFCAVDGYSHYMTGGLLQARPIFLAPICTFLLLTGCTGENSALTPASTVTAETSVTSETAVENSPPKAPAARKSAAGAEDFVRYFWEIHNYSYETLETKILKSIVSADCSFCSSTVHDLEKARDLHHSITGSQVEVHAVAAPPGRIKSRLLVAAVILQRSGTEESPDGSTRTFPAVPKTQATIALQWTRNKGWTIHGISLGKGGQGNDL